MTDNEILLALSKALNSAEDQETIKEDISLLKQIVEEYLELTRKTS